ncbi:MAG: hypothetical protein EOP61_10745 [Sphingomonadales bacterium]|nr:MAG: hypothetical protein EOP61_10745 [Sphingomonadales bacterium]
MDAPDTRYKVIERGRRLEVIDTWNGNAPVRPRADPMPAPRRNLEAAARALHAPPTAQMRAGRPNQRGRGPLRTMPWYDDKGPRQIAVTEAGEAKLKGLRIVALTCLFIAAVMAFLFWPLLFIAPFLILNDGARKSLRAASTKFLDELNQPVTRSSGG